MAGSEVNRQSVRVLFDTHEGFECTSSSPIVAFVFTSKCDTLRWKDANLAFGRRSISLVTGESLCSGNNCFGYDEHARSLLNQVHLFGLFGLGASRIHSSVSAATSSNVLDVEPVDGKGDNYHGPPRKIVTFVSTERLQELLRIRKLLKPESMKAAVHHARVSKSDPCRSCLSLRHLRKDCKVKDPVVAAACCTLEIAIVAAPGINVNPRKDRKGTPKEPKCMQYKSALEVAQRLKQEK
ncbi:hypothetical protein CCR75_008907 [Bremia lactucae]|uniref:Uncharacterized protein n=1 Tax=Bremia lactucae TaxID=4779 RepID=A0A976FR97_BRELC|nr:hypothetical protein CCR75_008907 [Bremia lactucae]